MAHDEYYGLINGPQTSFSSKAPFSIAYRSSKAFILITVCLALFTDSFVYGVLVPVLPFMLDGRSHIKPGTEQLWTSAMFAAFGIAILIGSPICGWFADRSTSRRLPLLFGLPILGGATVLIGLSANVWILLLSRLLQGFSTAITWTVGLALTRDTAGKDEVGQWMGTALSSSSIGLIISPLLGGIVFNTSGVFGVVGMMLALVVLNVLFITFVIERRVAYQYVVINSQDQGVDQSYGTFGGSEASIDSRKKHHSGCASADASSEEGETSAHCSCGVPDFPQWREESEPPTEKLKPPMLILLKSPRVLTGVYGVFTQFGLLASFDAFLPLFVERRFDWGSLGAGLVFLNIAIPALIGPLAGKISDRYGPRRVALAGCVFTAPPLFLLRLVGYNNPRQIVLMCALLVLIGIFLTLIISPLAADLSFAVDQMELEDPGCFGEKGAYAQAYALFNCSMAAASVVGPLLVGSIQARYGAPGVSLALGTWCISAALPVLFFIGDGAQAPHARDVEQYIPHRLSISQSPLLKPTDPVGYDDPTNSRRR